MPNFTKIFILECDSSGSDIEVVLMKEERTISFENNHLKGKNLLKPIYEN